MWHHRYHTIVVCLLVALGIGGTEGISLQFAYYVGTKMHEGKLRSCKGGTRYRLRAAPTYVNVYFQKDHQMSADDAYMLLFRNSEGESLCSVFYNKLDYVVTKDSKGNAAIKIRDSVSVYSNSIIVLHMDNARLLKDNGEPNSYIIPSTFSEEDNVWTFDVLKHFTIRYGVGTFPKYTDNPGCGSRIFNRMWSFKKDEKNLMDQRIHFSCGPSKPVKLYCESDKCQWVDTSDTATLSKNVVAYLIKGKEYKVVKGNTREPPNVFCRLYVDGDYYQTGFPRKRGKRHVNLIYIGKGRSKRGFRLYTDSLEECQVSFL